ncbi:MAG: hypothetical protein IJH32_02380 [Ruminococcus sp.]|nr:hypothetical protein [Ruminococcus sp.]
MADSLKDSWKETGKGLGQAFKGLGKTVIKSAEKGVDKAVEWADREDKITCSSCSTVNPPGSKFCSGCGKAL